MSTEQKRFEEWWDAKDDIPNNGPWTHDTPIQFAWAGWQAALAQPEQEPVAWTPVAAALPPSGKPVLACYTNRLGNVRRIRAKWIPAKFEESDSDHDFGEYDEESDTYYDPEGWYECMNNWDEYSAVFVSEGKVTHWMPMPADPYTAPQPAQQTRQWQGLTDAEIEGLLPSADGSAEENKVPVEVQPGMWGVEYEEVDAWSLPLVRQAIRAIEAKLREKNT